MVSVAPAPAPGTTEPAEAADFDAPAPGDRRLTTGLLVALGALVWGLFLGLRQLQDNSLLTHIATGRIILDRGVPHSDPYLFTPHESHWVVQSWLASLVYGIADKLAEGRGVQYVTAVLSVALAALVVRLSRPTESLLGRLALVGVAMTVGAGAWAPRPFLFGLVFLGLTVLAAEGGLDSRWMLPITWLWVNTHGSFPLGFVVLVLLAGGRRLDGERPAVELRCLRWAGIGLALSVVNPFGPKLLVFPLELLRRGDLLSHIVEWQAPTFTVMWQKVFLVQIAVAVLLLVRRPSYRLGLVLAALGPAALYSARNIPVASLVLVAVMAPALRDLGTLSTRQRLPSRLTSLVAAGAFALLGAVVVSQALARPAFQVAGYPVAALNSLERQGLVPPVDGSHGRLLAQDFVGNFRELRDGPTGDVFVDDRVEVMDRQVGADYTALLKGDPTWAALLDRYDVNVVLWSRSLPLASLLKEAPGWRIVYQDADWMAFQRR